MCGWLHEQGLGLYVAQCQSWIKSGQTLLQASQHELEKVRLPPVGSVSVTAVLKNKSVNVKLNINQYMEHEKIVWIRLN